MAHEIETERLRLRPIENQDLDEIHSMWTDREVRRYLWDDEVISKTRAKQEIDHSRGLFSSNGFGLWVLLPKQSGPLQGEPRLQQNLIGFCGLRFVEGSSDVELLFGLDLAHCGSGYATEASKAVLHRAFEVSDCDEVLGRTDFPNKASVRVMERLGMTFVERKLLNGLETLSYSISREQFFQARR